MKREKEEESSGERKRRGLVGEEERVGQNAGLATGVGPLRLLDRTLVWSGLLCCSRISSPFLLNEWRSVGELVKLFDEGERQREREVQTERERAGEGERERDWPRDGARDGAKEREQALDSRETDITLSLKKKRENVFAGTKLTATPLTCSKSFRINIYDLRVKRHNGFLASHSLKQLITPPCSA